jgi:excisionase family DNA binding protein
MVNEKYLSPNAAARRLGVTVDYFYKLLWSGKVEAQKVNQRWRVPKVAVEQRLKAREEREALNG